MRRSDGRGRVQNIVDQDGRRIPGRLLEVLKEDLVMKVGDLKFALVCLLVLAGVHSTFSMTIEPVDPGRTGLVAKGDIWKFFRGTVPPSEPADAWKEINFNDSAWESGASGFGYGDNDDTTMLDDMEDNYVTVYIRKEFQASSLPPDRVVQLVIDYDDGFIAYINGKKVADRHMPDETPTYETTASSHEAGTPEAITLGTVGDLLNDGNNVIAIEGHNISKDSSDFSLIPVLQAMTDTAMNGDTWIVGTGMVSLDVKTDVPGVVSVTVGGADAHFDPGRDTWTGDVSLVPGLNVITAEALDTGASVIDSASMEIVYVPPEKHVAGELAGNSTWSGAYIIEETVVVPTQVVLSIEPGTTVFIRDGAGLTVYGQLLADGTEAEQIHFTHFGDGTTWARIMLIEAEDSRLAHCIFEYSDCEGEHQDYYKAGTRDYHEAIVVLASHLDVEDCIFQNLPDYSGDGEGDALAIMSDDPEHPGEASADIVGSQFLSIGQAIHTRFSYVLVEDCYFTGKNGDNDDVDLWGESTPPPLVLNNLFLNPTDDDMINPTKCSAIIVGNTIIGSKDHCVVLRDVGHPVMIDNVICNCKNGGIAIENTSKALLINNTITDVYDGPGLKLFDLGRAGAPYYLTKGGGSATVVNCIVRDCQTSISVTDSHQIDNEPNAGSHVTVMYSNIEGGRDDVSISQEGNVLDSTVTWLEGNVDVDPLFADASGRDFHLKSQAGRWDPMSESWVIDQVTSPCIDAGTPYAVDGPNYAYAGQIDWRGELWPHGKKINMGGYGGTPQASMSLSGEGSGADYNNDDAVDGRDVRMLADKWLAQAVLLAEDINRDGRVDFLDFAEFALQWLWEQ
jgi:hypothetical protein